MSDTDRKRRESIWAQMGVMAVGNLDCSSPPVANIAVRGDGRFDAVFIGAGMDGLSCAAAFADRRPEEDHK